MATSLIGRHRSNHKPYSTRITTLKTWILVTFLLCVLQTALAGEGRSGFSGLPKRSLGLSSLPPEGPGGPVLILTSPYGNFGRYYAEILKAEGWNLYSSMDISEANSGVLSGYDVIVLSEMLLTTDQALMLSDWVNGGGTLVAMRPSTALHGLLGIVPTGNSLADAFQLFRTSQGPGVGLIAETIQFHGTADLYNMVAGTETIATLYSGVNTPTAFPAATRRTVGPNGGQAIMFAYDMARSIVYTRQGNPAWSGQERDGEPGPIRSNDLFFGNAASDPKPDWVNLSKVEIPQADELQRLLSNIIVQGSANRKPLPRFWFLPKGLKATVVMTGDDHALGGTAERFQQYEALSGVNNTIDDVNNWLAIRSTSYIYPGTPITPAQVAEYQSKGFEIALHPNTDCQNFTQTSLENTWSTQWQALLTQLPNLASPVTNRTHCLAWSDWATQAKVQAARGVRLDANYYYWPGTWVQNRPGMFTGSGMPMRFADTDGTLIDCYQLATQMTDESSQAYPETITALLDKAIGPEGFFGVFCANMHTDYTDASSRSTIESNAIVNAALARQIPVISARQMLDWLDGRNGAAFSNLVWNANTLTFSVTADASLARNIQAMLPKYSQGQVLQEIRFNGIPLAMTSNSIKGVEYMFFSADAGSYEAIYGPDPLLPEISNIVVVPHSDGHVDVSWQTNKSANSRVIYGASASNLNSNVFDGAMVVNHTMTLSGLTPQATYYLRVQSVDGVGQSVIAPAEPQGPISFSIPCLTTGTLSTFGAICAGMPIQLRFNASAGTGPFSLVINGNTINNVTNNVTFNSGVNAATSADVSLWGSSEGGAPASTDASGVELGVKFRATAPGLIRGIRFFKTLESGSGTFDVKLWNAATGQLVDPVNGTGTITFSPESTASGWQTVYFSSPVFIQPNTTYIATYRVPNGRYAFTNGYFSSARTVSYLEAPSSDDAGGNGVYRYQNDGSMPIDSYQSSNYWVDVLFKPLTDIALTEIVDASGCQQDGNLQTLYINAVDCSFLPVSLSEFGASVSGSTVHLKWRTSSENNNKGFVVQRSQTGQSWDSIGFVRGAGNSQQILSYTFTDPELASGQYYYRLRQVDLDGKATLSKIVSVQVRESALNRLEQNYPNPSIGTTMIRYSISSNTMVSIDLYDLQGRLVRSLVHESKDAGTHVFSLKTDQLQKGVYFYLLKTKEFTASRRLLVE